MESVADMVALRIPVKEGSLQSEAQDIRPEIGELEAVQKRRDELTGRKREFGQRLKELEKKFRRSELDELRNKKQEFAAKEAELAARIKGIDDRLEDKVSVKKDMEDGMARLSRYKRLSERDNCLIEDMASFEKALKITQDQLREEFLRTVNVIMEDVWQELYPYGDFQGIRLFIEDDYVLQLQEAAGWISVEGTVSGGERSMATLALRIAFSMAFLPNLKWLMLDEPTHNLDANAIRQFSSILREKMDLFAEQVFLITHEERISEGVTGQLYRMERDKAKDEPTVVKSI